MTIYKYRKRGYCWNCGKRTSHQDNQDKYFCLECSMKSIENTLDEREKEIISKLNKSKLSIDEIDIILSSKSPCIKNTGIRHDYKKNHVKLGIIADMHIGSKYFNEAGFKYSRDTFEKEKVDAIYCPGDIIEGMSQRDGQIYDLSDLGYTEQLEHAYKLLNTLNKPFFFITGNHDMWGRNKGNMGLQVGKEVQKNVPNAKYLGDMEADIIK
jgi:hypothetical protein